MRRENVQVVLRYYEAMGKRDLAALEEIIHPEHVLRLPELLPYGGPWHGVQGVKDYLAGAIRCQEPGASWVEYYEIYAAGETVFDTGTIFSRTRAGVDFVAPFLHVKRVRDGQILGGRSYVDQAPMLLAFEGRRLPPSPFPRTAPIITHGTPREGTTAVPVPAVPEAPTENIAWAPTEDPAGQASIAVVQQLLEALETGEALDDVVAPDCVLYVPGELPHGGVYHGPEGYLAHRSALLALQDPDAEPLRIDVHAFHAVGGAVADTGVLSGRMRNGVEYGAPLATIHTVRDGKVVRSQLYLDAARILFALGGRWWTPPSRYVAPEPVLTVRLTSARPAARSRS